MTPDATGTRFDSLPPRLLFGFRPLTNALLRRNRFDAFKGLDFFCVWQLL